ncbi:MAG: hypothetical protein K8J31_22305 [Anaerolineae bacterium]|nr:hypothetical protein [Anaerolineae bacterium]
MHFLRRWLVILMVLLTLLLIVPILLIRAQPYERGHLATFLIPPEDCRAPCFMGVRPQQTTVEQAVAMLRANDAVEQVQIEYYYRGLSIFWRWKSSPSEFRDYAFQVDETRLVTQPVLPPTVRLGDMQLILGPPERVTAAVLNEYQPRAAIVLEYPALGMYLFIGMYPCQMDQAEFWRMHYEASLYGAYFLGLGEPNYARMLPNSRRELDPNTWAKQFRDFCRAR